jgi:hypothetical protein
MATIHAAGMKILGESGLGTSDASCDETLTPFCPLPFSSIRVLRQKIKTAHFSLLSQKAAREAMLLSVLES